MIKTRVSLRADRVFGSNSKIINKPQATTGTGFGGADYSKFNRNEGTINSLIEAIQKGSAITPWIFDGAKRSQKNIIKSDYVFLDIDNTEIVNLLDDNGDLLKVNGKQQTQKVYTKKLTLDEARLHPFVKQYGILYTTPSHTDEWHKFRIIFILPRSLNKDESELYCQIIREIDEILGGGVIDASCVETARLFYGNNNARWFVNEDIEELPEWVIEKALDTSKKVTEDKNRRILENAAKRQAYSIGDNNVDLAEIEKMLSFISPADYESWVTVGLGLSHRFNRSDEGFKLWDDWSSTADNYDGSKTLYRKWQSFNPWVANPITMGTVAKKAFDGGYKFPPSKDKKAIDRFNNWKLEEYNDLTTFTADKTFEARFCRDYVLENVPSLENKILAVKVFKGGGKSYMSSSLSAREQRPVLKITHRVMLGRQNCRVKKGEKPVTYIDEFFKGKHQDKVRLMALNDESMGICIDSLTMLADIDLSNYIVEIDEAVQVHEALMIGKTHIEKVRGMVWAILELILKSCYAVVLLDADANDRVIDYFQQASNNKEVIKIQNLYTENKRTCYIYEKKDNLIASLEKSLQKGENNLLVIDSEKEGTALYHLLKAKYKTLLITRESLANDPTLHEYLKNKGRDIRREKFQLVIASPVINTGISIQIGEYFKNNYGVFVGVLPTNGVRQFLMRDRGQGDRHIWAANRGIGYKSEYSHSEIHTINDNQGLVHLWSTTYVQQLENCRLGDAYIYVGTLINLKIDVHCLSSEHVAKVQAVNNLNKSLYKVILLKELAIEGYELLLGDTGHPIDLGKEVIKEKRDELSLEFATMTFESKDIDEKMAEIYNSKPVLTRQQEAELLKYQVKRRLPEFEPLTAEFIDEFVLKGHSNIIRGIENMYYAQNPSSARIKDSNSVSYALSQCSQGAAFYCNAKNYHLLPSIFDTFEPLINADITNESAQSFLRDVPNIVRSNLRTFGVRWSNKNNGIATLKRIFELFSYSVSFHKKTSKTRIYKIETSCDKDLWMNIYMSVNHRITNNLKIELSSFEQVAETVALLGSIHIPELKKVPLG